MADIELALVDEDSFEKSEEGDLTVIFYGNALNTYNIHELPQHKHAIESMLCEVFEEGKKARSKEISELLGLH